MDRAEPPQSDGSSVAVLEYLRTLQCLVEAQRDVMLSYLSDRSGALPVADLGVVEPTNGSVEAGDRAWANGNGRDAIHSVPTPAADAVTSPIDVVPDAPPAPPAPDPPVTPTIPATTRRFVLEAETLAPALPVASLTGQNALVISDLWEGLDELCRRLTQAGATVEVMATPRGARRRALPEHVATRLSAADVVVHLGAADIVSPVDAREVFATLQSAVTGRATTIVAAVAAHQDPDSTVVSGVGGLMRSIARELPDRHVRVVEVPPTLPSKVLARLLADEVLDPAGPASIRYRNGLRTTRRVTRGMPLREVPALPLNDGSVVVVTGGARGITARATIALARETGCRLELLGRTPLAVDEDPRIAAATHRTALRRALVETGEVANPPDVEAACDRILAGREVRSTLAALRDLGVSATYHPVDVRDADALGLVLAGIRARHGRIDAVIHGAGVVDDRLASDKTADRFHWVFATKVDAARTLLDHLDGDTRLVVFFGSVSGVFGNRGQVDYSAANDALDQLAVRLDGAHGRRIVSIDWGPWAGTGMVSPELEREYGRRGVGLIDPDDGVRALLAEMATLPGEPAQVVVMRAEPEALEGRPRTAPGTFATAGAAVHLDEHDPEQDAEHSERAGHPVSLEDVTEPG